MIIKAAWRNIWRNRRRTILTTGSIAFGLLIALTFTAIQDGSGGKMIDSTAKMNAGHVTIEPKDFLKARSMDETVRDVTPIIRQASALPEVSGTNVRIMGQCMASTASGSVGAAIYGINYEAEKGTLYVLDHITSGEGLSEGDTKSVLIGRKMTELLDLKLHSKLVVTLTDKRGEVVSGLLKVKGIFETGVPSVDRSVIIVPINWARGILGYGGNEANVVAIQLKDRNSAGRIAGIMEPAAKAEGTEAYTWRQTMPDLYTMLSMKQSSNRVLFLFIFVIIGAGILNTVLMGVMERLPELGVMRAIGMSPLKLWLSIMAETIMIGMVGILIGIIISSPLLYRLATHGLNMSSMLANKATTGNIAFEPIFRAEISMNHMVPIIAGVMIVIILAGLYPSILAARIKPLNAIKSI